ncbi:MAG: tetratricopeptide repeat protein [Thermodesulfobacteriota bacterium]
MRTFGCSSSVELMGWNQRGWVAFTFLGVAIIIVVILGTIFLFPWSQMLDRTRVDKDYQEASEALAAGNWNKALTLFGRSLRNNPRNTPAIIGRSRAYLQLRNLDEAFQEINKALEIDPRNALAFGQRAIIEKLRRNYDQALKDLGQAVKLDPGYAWAYAQSADILLRGKDMDKAVQEVNLALKLRPDFAEALRLRARINTGLGKCKEAFEDFNRAEKLRPDDAQSLQDKAWFLLTCPDESIQDAGEALRLALRAHELSGGKDGIILETLAEAYYQIGQPAKAVEHQRTAVDLEKRKCPDGSCIQEMSKRLQKYELAARQETRPDDEILPLDCCTKKP